MLKNKVMDLTSQVTGILTPITSGANKLGSLIDNKKTGHTHAIINVTAAVSTAATAGEQLYVFVLFDGESGSDTVDPAKAAIGSIGASGDTNALTRQFDVDNLFGRDFRILVQNEWSQDAGVTVECDTYCMGGMP